MEERDNGADSYSVGDQIEKEQLQRAIITLDGKKRGDGNVVTMSEAQLGVLQKMVSVRSDDEEYRMILLLARLPKERARLAANCISFLRDFGGDINPILDSIIAETGAEGHARDDAIEALTNMRLTTTYSGQKNETNTRSGIR